MGACRNGKKKREMRGNFKGITGWSQDDLLGLIRILGEFQAQNIWIRK